jgi:hypothetical protein
MLLNTPSVGKVFDLARFCATTIETISRHSMLHKMLRTITLIGFSFFARRLMQESDKALTLPLSHQHPQ